MRPHRTLSRFAICCALLFVSTFTTLSAVAQFDSGSFIGTVHDASGAVVPGATVVVTNPQTGISATRTTDDSGSWEVPSLHTGTYIVKISHAGFSDAWANDLTLSVGARERVDLVLNAAGSSETVEVSGVSLQLETENSERGQTVTGYQSAALPLVSRNYSDLLGLVVGVRQAPTSATTTSVNSLTRAGSYNVNGQRSMFNNFLLDGMDNNAYGESNQGFDNQIIAIPPDSVAQFQVVTNNESAEYGRSSGATVNVASNSGTNRIHATAYEFLRNTDLNAAGYFKPTIKSNTGAITPFKKPTFNRNQFGGNVGGPIIKDKLFFFLDYEGFRQTLKPLSVFTLPTQNELNGILTVAVKNPVTGQTYAEGTPIPTSAINPISQQVIGFFKQISAALPISGDPTQGIASNDYSVQVPFTDKSDKGDLRFDYQQSPASSWFLRISDRKENGVNFPALPLPLDGQTNGSIRVLNQQVALGYTHLIGSNKVLDARVGLSRTKAGKYTLSIGDNAITIPGLPTNPVVAGGLPSIAINGFTGFGRQSTNPQWQDPAVLDPKVNFTWVKGRHSMKFGYEYEHVWMAVNDNNPLYGSFNFGGGYSNAGGSTVSDNYWADFLFGNTSSYSLANYFVAHLRQTTNNAYVQDDFKVNQKLTLNLGLRWEYSSPYSEQNHFVSNFDPTTQTVLTTTPGASGVGITPYSGSGGVYGHTLVNPDYTDFGPRLGFAYAAPANLAIRGGFGISYAHYTRAGSADVLPINAPQAQFATVPQIVPTATDHCTTLPAEIIPINGTTPSCYSTLDQGFPSALVTAFNPATDAITYIPRNTKDSYVESFYLSVQRQLAKNTLLDISYVGNHGLKLQGFVNANQKNPAILTNNAFTRPYANWPSDITEALNEFSSNYNALQVKYEQRSVMGLTLLNSFTWSHSLDNASAALEGNTPAPQDANNISADYSQSDYNLPIANVTSLIYELPVGRGRRFLNTANPIVDGVLGGWQLSLINTAQAGTPFNLAYTPNSANIVSTQISANYRGANDYRPNIVPGKNLTQGRSVRLANTGYVQYVNLAAFTLPATKIVATATTPAIPLSPFGNSRRNPARTPAFYQSDFDLNKRFSTPIESMKVEFRTEFYNVFNHTNLYLPSSGLSGALGGNASSGGVISSTFEPRIVQFGLKVIY